MDFQDLIRARYSVRAYKADPVPEALLSQVLEAARLAPTAANRQPFRVFVIPTKGHEDRLCRLYAREWLLQAPLLLAVCTVPGEAWQRSRFDGKNLAEVDAAIVMDHLTLAAADLGLGTCWIAAFDPAVARELLDLPPGMEAQAFTPLGYAADQPAPKTRRPLADLVVDLRG